MYVVKFASGSILSAHGITHAEETARQWSVLRDGESFGWVDVRGGRRLVAVGHEGIRRVLATVSPA